MRDGFRQSMAWLHTWAGVVVGWVLFFIFLTGTLGYFDTEIDRWMRPELPINQPALSQRGGLAQGLARLEAVAPAAREWTVYPPMGRDVPLVSIYWNDASGPGGSSGSETLDSATGEPVAARATGGGQVLYQMHYLLHYLPSRWAYWIVGLCTMFMLTAIVSGVITHKRIFKDFFTFRPGKGQRSWLDFHNVLSVLALPFHAMITYSGLVFFAFTYMTLVVSATYGAGPEDRSRFFDDAFHNPEIPPPAGVAVEAAPYAPMIAAADSFWGEGQVRTANIVNRGDRNARVVLTRGHVTPVSNGGRLVFSGVSGALLERRDRSRGPDAVNDAMLGLHEGLFAGAALRWLYFVSGLVGTAMIGTGLVLWTAKRASEPADSRHTGHALVERLNVGTIAGLPVAIAAYFWANRVLPVEFAGRADWEVHVLFIAWGAMLLHALVCTPARAWVEQCWLAAAALALLPVVNVLTTDAHLAASLAARDWTLAGFDLTVLGAGVSFGVAARRLGRRVAAHVHESADTAPERRMQVSGTETA